MIPVLYCLFIGMFFTVRSRTRILVMELTGRTFGGMMNQFVMATIGGALIGVAASILLLTQGRIAGISGITGSLFQSEVGDKGWRWAFFMGLMFGGCILAMVSPEVFVVSEDRPLWMMGLAGLLVGFGTQMGNGCTSGHGVCGITRLSPRSMVATVTFIVAGMFIATVMAGGLT